MMNKTHLRSSTNQVPTGQFKAHGQVDIRMEGDLLHYIATGPFNKELLDCLAVAQLSFLQAAQPTGAWVSICTMQESAVTSPEGLARYNEIMRTPKPAGLTPVATAFVIGPEVEGGKLMAPHYAKIYAAIGRPFQTFSTMAEAQTWAQDMIDWANEEPASQA